ncbi:hypothetical protein OIV83_001496 [Microbotryomycetes sp. JL201]|nr:hypothetical protein OIV83_001496 [Microbotryomycetes sp. JL201]
MASSASGSSSDSIDRLFEAVEQTFAQAWELVTSQSPNLHDLPHQVHESFTELINKVTNNGTLPVPPSWRDLVPAHDQAASAATAPLDLGRSASSSSALGRATQRMHAHPWWTVALLTTTVTGTAYYCAPNATQRALKPLARPLLKLVPVALLPNTSRPHRIVTKHGDEQRKEAVLVLGAHGVAADLALDLEQRGFVVIATVTNPRDVDALEKRSRGWIKVLVLDPLEASSVPPFLRSLSTALSLRFPLHTSGDPYAAPSQTPALTAVVNCLSLCEPSTALCPVEGFDGDDVRRAVGERVATVIGCIKGVLPMLRTSAGRPGRPDGSLISLVPAPSANLALPYLSLASAADAAIVSLLHSLRRELSTARLASVRIQILETGFFDSPRSLEAAPLPVRLQSLYAPALARRSGVGAAPTVRNTCARRKTTQPRQLFNKVFNMIVHERGGRVASTGSGSLTYRLLSFMPHFVVDVFFAVQDRLFSMYLGHRSRIRSAVASPSASVHATSTASTRAYRSPLPTPSGPNQSAHPSSLRPGHSPTATTHIPIDTTFETKSSRASSVDGGATSGEDDSLDGDLMSSSQVEGSFVQIDRKSSS